MQFILWWRNSCFVPFFDKFDWLKRFTKCTISLFQYVDTEQAVFEAFENGTKKKTIYKMNGKTTETLLMMEFWTIDKKIIEWTVSMVYRCISKMQFDRLCVVRKKTKSMIRWFFVNDLLSIHKVHTHTHCLFAINFMWATWQKSFC